MHSNELIKLEEINTGEIYQCNPNQEFKMPFGKWKSWNEARLVENEETVLILKAGEIIANHKPKRRKIVQDD